jgi:O-antigen ligase
LARQFWLPSQFFEIATIIFAFTRGCAIRREVSTYSKAVRNLALIWLAAMALASALAPQPNTAMLGAISWVIHALFAVSAFFLFKRWQGDSSADWRAIFATWMPTGSVVFVALILGFVAIVGFESKYDWVSSLPGFTHIRHSGYFLMPAMALSTGMIAISAGRLRVVHMALLAINFGFAIWIGSRGPLIIYFILLVSAVVLFAAMRNMRALGAILLSLAAGALLSQALPAPAHSSFNAISRIEGGKSQSVDKLSSGRTDIWRGTIGGIVDRPLIGHGGNQFRLLVPAARETYNHPHNSVLQFTYEWGVIGGGALLCLLVMLAWQLLKRTIARPSQHLPLFLAAASMAMFSLIDGVFYYNLPIMLFLTCAFGILVQREPASAQ